MYKIPTYEELMARDDIQFISECDGYLYILLPPDEFFDDTIWRVNKDTKEVSYFMFISYLRQIKNRATYIKAPVWETQSEKEERGA